MTEPTQVQDPRELIGYPRTPLRKLSRSERSAIKKKLLEAHREIDPVMAVRMALSSGILVRPEWLQAGQIDLALETEDILRNIHKLTIATKLINATQVIAVLSKRAERTPRTVLRALEKLTLPKRSAGELTARTMLDRDTALQTIRLATALVPLLCRGQAVKSKRSIPRALLEIVFCAAESWPVLEVAIEGLEFLRVIEKDVSWVEIEKPPMEKMRHSLLRLPAVLIQDVLQRGALVEATLLSERVRLYGPAEKVFETAVAKTLAEQDQLPLASKNWATRFLRPESEQESVSESVSPTGGDAASERLALVLINAWEAREDGKNAAHAFSVCEEIFRNGFNVHLCGTVGSNVIFDPDVHVSNRQLLPGAMGQVVRPWVELKSANDVRILIKARVIAAP
jgi:hypothetical protein